MGETEAGKLSAFARWLRTGLCSVEVIERKFNPWHDPRDGRFTFAPGGPRSLEQVIVADRRQPARKLPNDGATVPRVEWVRPGQRPSLIPAVFRPGEGDAAVTLTGAAGRPPGRRPLRSDNGSGPPTPTLVQVFPGLRTAPGGSIIAAVDNLFGITAPAAELTTELNKLLSERLVEDITALNPRFVNQSLGFPSTAEGQARYIAELRWQRAKAYMEIRKDFQPLQVEVLRFVQQRVDHTYNDAMRLVRAGRMAQKPSEPLNVGNFIDRRVRDELRTELNRLRINHSASGPVRVNKREPISDEGTYRIPDIRVDRLIIDMTIAEKTTKTPQVRGYFAADMNAAAVIIARPRQLGRGSTYLIKRPR